MRGLAFGLLAVSVLLGVPGCWNFDRAYEDCVQQGGRCAPDAGPSDAGALNAGPSFDGGDEDAGADGGADAGLPDAGSPCDDLGCASGTWCVVHSGAEGFWKVRGAGEHLVAAGTGGAFVHFDGCTLRADIRSALLSANGVWMSADAGVAWVVGSADAGSGQNPTKTWHRYTPGDGGWTVFPSTMPNYIQGVWGSAPNDLWSVGYGFSGVNVYRSAGGAWSAVTGENIQSQNGVWGSSANDVWVVGRLGDVQHWNGSVWTPYPDPVSGDLYAVWGDAPGNFWATGASGALIRWNGSSWTVINSDTSDNLYDVFGAGGGAVWVAGGQGELRHVTPTGEVTVVPIPITFATTRSVYVSPSGAIWVATSAGELLVKLP